MDVAGKRRLGRVEISVRVDVKHAEPLALAFCGCGGSGKRAEHEQAGGKQEQDVLLGIDQRPSGEQEQDAEQNEEKADAEVFEIFKHGLAECM